MKLIVTGLLTLLLMACQQQPTETAVKQNETSTIKACTKDLKICPGGQSVGRDSENQCQFFPCPEASAEVDKELMPVDKVCNDDIKTCADGGQVKRNPLNKCEFYACEVKSAKPQKAMMCSQEVKQCPDGSYVGRDSYNKCAFKPCKNGNDSNTN